MNERRSERPRSGSEAGLRAHVFITSLVGGTSDAMGRRRINALGLWRDGAVGEARA